MIVTAAPSEHVLGHLSAQQREVALQLVTNASMDDIAAELDRSRRTIEGLWVGIRDRLQLYDEQRDGRASAGSFRVALVRILYGIDPCPCGRGDR